MAITTGGVAGLAAAMIGALWAYDGWNNITFLAGEVKNPGAKSAARFDWWRLSRDGALPVCECELLPRAHADADRQTCLLHRQSLRRWSEDCSAQAAVTLMAAAMMTSSFGALHASLLATSRVPYALAKDGLAPKALSHVSHTHTRADQSAPVPG